MFIMRYMKKILIAILIVICVLAISCEQPGVSNTDEPEKVFVPEFFRGEWNGRGGTFIITETSVSIGGVDLLTPYLYSVAPGPFTVRQSEKTDGEDKIYAVEAWEKGADKPTMSLSLLVHGGLRLTVTSTVLGAVTVFEPFYNV